jgi:type I restriction enzyme S subunit
MVHGGFMLLASSDEPEFVNALMSSQWYTRFINVFVAGGNGAIGNLNKNDLDEQIVLVPSMKERKKIGTYFSNIDNLITLHQRQYYYEKKQPYYIIYICVIKNIHLFFDFIFIIKTFSWEQRKLGDMVSFSKGSGYSKGDLKENGTPIILYGRLYTKYEIVISEVDTFADEKKGSVFSKGGEVIVPASGETAEDISIASVVEKSGVLLGGDLNIITPSGNLDSVFLAISISNGKPHEDMAKMAQGKSVVHLHNADLEKIDLVFPSFAEQQHISWFFSGLDNLITLHQRKLGA